MQAALERHVRAAPGWDSLLQRRSLAIGVVDLTDVARPRFASIDGDQMMYAASLPKIALLLAAVQGFEDGVLGETPDVVSDLHDMIRVSSNRAATRTFDRLGIDYVAAVLTDPRYRPYSRNHGGLWVGKPYAERAPRRPDPKGGIVHAATVIETCRFYYLLATGRLVSPTRSRQILDVLRDPGIDHKLVRSLEQRCPRARCFRKSGTWRSWHSDSILVWGPDWRRYILVVLVEDPGGEQIIRDMLPAVERVLRPSS